MNDPGNPISRHGYEASKGLDASSELSGAQQSEKKILLVRTDSIGDNVIFSAMLPALREKYSGAAIGVVCQNHIAELYNSNPFVDAVFPFDRIKMSEENDYQRHYLEALQGFAADVALNTVFSRDTLSDFITLGSNARVCIAFNGDLSNIRAEDKRRFDEYYNRLIDTKENDIDEFSRMADYLEALGIHAAGLKPILPLTAADEAYADRILNENSFDATSTIAVFPRAQYDIKDYPYVAGVLAALSSEMDFSFIGLGSARDISEVESALSAVPENRRVNLSGRTSLLQMAAVLKRCRLALGVDTAAAHMACAVGTPNVAIVGGGHFGRFFPYSSLTSVVALPLECYGCNWKCRFTTSHCIKDVDPEVVAEAVRQSLSTGSEKPRVFVQGTDKWQSVPGKPKWEWFDGFVDTHAVDIIPIGKVADLPTPKGRLLKAEAEINSGNLARARHILGELLEKHADSIDALNDLAVIDILQKNYDRALGYISRVLSLQGDNQIALGNLKYLQSEEKSPSPGNNGQPVSLRNNKATEKGNISPERNVNHVSILVSAIVSTYNSAKYIRGCLDDLINQTLYRKGQMEIIVVNSGSLENEHEIVDEYMRRYPNIRYIKTAERETVYQAWNRGIRIACGEYITNANTDDRHHEDALRRMADLLDADDSIGLVYADQFVTKTENEAYSSANPVGHFDWPEFDKLQLIHCSCCGPQPMWRRALHDVYGYFDERLVVAGDYEWWLRISDKVTFKHIPEKLGLYLLAPTSVEHSNAKSGNTETSNLRAEYARRMGLKRLDYSRYKSTFLVMDPKVHKPRSAESLRRENRPTVSVILPTHNRPDFLRRAISSVLAQTREDFEIMVVNDGGTDVGNIIDAFHDTRIRYLVDPTNKGMASARNAGLKIAKGKYVAYLDDDDTYLPCHLEILLGFLEDHDETIVAYSDAYRAYQVKTDSGYETTRREVPYSSDFDRANLLLGNYIPNLCVVHKRDVLDKIGLFDESLRTHEDWDFWVRMSREFQFRHIRQVTCEVSWREDGTTTTSSSQADFEVTRRIVWSKYSKYFTEEAESLIQEGNLPKAERFLRAALGIFPEGADLVNDLAVVCSVTGRPDESITLLDRLVTTNPGNVVAHKNLASLLVRMNRVEDALRSYSQVLRLTPNDSDAVLAVAEICRALGRNADAVGLYQRVLQLEPGNQLAEKRLTAFRDSSQGRIEGHQTLQCAAGDTPTSTTGHLVSIIIPVFNKVEFTKQCLQSISERVRYSKYEVIVVDNASTDETREFMTDLVSKQAKFRYIRNETNLGFVDACNVGAESAKGDYILLLNNDTVVNDNWLEALVDFAEETPDCGAVGSKLIYPNGRLQEAGGIIFSDANGWNYGRGASPDNPKFNFVREVDYISGASLMVRKGLWKKVGGLDRRYSPAYYEDADLCFAIRSLGYKVYYEPRSSVVHYEGITSGTNLQEGFKKFQIVNKPKFEEKWKRELACQHVNDPVNVEKASSRGIGGRILVVDPFLPMYDRASGSLRTFHLLKTLKSMGFHITYIATNRKLSNDYRPVLEQLGIETYAGDRDGMAYLGQESKAPRIDYESLLRGGRFDYALIDFWYEAEYYLPIIRRLSPSTQIIIDTVDVHWVREFREAQLQNDQVVVQRATENKKREMSIYKQADRLWVVTPTDEDEIRKYVPDVPTDVVPNVHDNVDLNTEFDSTTDILFVGNFNHLPNRDAVCYFAKDIWPVIRKALPNVKFYIVGNNPSDDVRALASDNVIVTGYVKDLTPHWQSARVSVVPLRYGAGMKGKLGDALSHGIPTVSTSVGIEGMSLVDGEEVLVADEPAAFAEGVVRLYSDREMWEKLSVGGQAKIGRLYSPSQIRVRLEKVFQELVTGGESKTSGLTSIVILTYNQLKFTKITIDSIRRHTKIPYEIIVVDNASTDGTADYLRAQKDIRAIFNEENVGFPAGCNQGMEIAKGDYIVLLNNDVIVTDDWLKGLIECSGADPQVGIVGPRTNWISGYQLETEITYKKVSQLPSFAARYRRKNRRKWIEVPRVAGFCMLIKREVLEKVGGLDTLFGIGNCEDDDFCLRSKLSGFKVALAGDVFIHHFGSKSFNQKGMEKYLDTVRAKEKVFEDKWGVDPSEWWRDGKSPTKSPALYVPLIAGEPVPVSQ